MGPASSTTYTQSYREDGLGESVKIPSGLQTLPDFLRHRAETCPDGAAVVFVSMDGRRTTVKWKDWYTKATIAARSMLALGVKEREFVAIALRPCPEWLYVAYGVMMTGAVPVPVSFTYSDGSDFIAMMEKLQTVSLLVLDVGTEGTNLDIVKRFLEFHDKNGHATSEKVPYLRYCVYHGDYDSGFLTLDQLMERTNDDIKLPEIDPDSIAALFQTSGSTGVPKAVAHTHASLAYLVHRNVPQQAKTTESDQTQPTRNAMFNDRPFTWLGGFPLNVLMGDTRVTCWGSDKHTSLEERIKFTIDVVKREKCTTLACQPQFLDELMNKQDLIGDNWPVNIIIIGGQPIPQRSAQCLGKLCHAFGCSYGGTELLATAFHIATNIDHFSDHCCGNPAKGVGIKIVDENQDIVPVGVLGEIYIRSKGLFKEYYNDPEKTSQAFTQEGWFRTDDLGHMTENGILYVKGRKSDIIISGTMNVLPSILEGVLSSYPGVSDVVCVPVPDEAMFQVVCACIKLGDGSKVTEEELRTFCEEIHNDRSGIFTVLPKYFIFMDNFPVTRTGKVPRKELAKEARNILASKKIL